MAKATNTPVHAGGNVIPFPERENRSAAGGENLVVEEKEVDVLVCSLCGSNSFHLLADMTGEIGCAECGFLIGAHWDAKEFYREE